jgi:hypothetical protein
VESSKRASANDYNALRANRCLCVTNELTEPRDGPHFTEPWHVETTQSQCELKIIRLNKSPFSSQDDVKGIKDWGESTKKIGMTVYTLTHT